MSIPRSEYLSSQWIENRVVFVTGGAGSICSAQTRAMVYLGANACIIGRNAQKTESVAADIATARKGAKVLAIACDVRDVQSLSNAAERCVKELGSIDFLIAGAAGNFVAPITGLTSNGFKSVMDIDALGTFNTVKATIPYLIESAARNPNPSTNGLTGGRIICISATFHYTGMPMQAHVAAAKAAVDSISSSVALEFGPYGITSNVIAPGGIEGTEGMERLASSKATKDMTKHIPLGRLGTLRDVADATVYLFSDAGNYVNGNVLVVDGADWRNKGMGVGRDPDMQYPDFLLKGEFSKFVKTGRKEKPKL
ncbi:hypothetical protein ONZ43_g7752 [Nemania bipapillata]|uniref:Uncharacterized protein n=1 Tax=Nemania bipapillata TaxID=110536 RepID=A0ACC2HNK8_9PEZI|nr:hypothetical protein ONZ43_g7752 [Nemania bipapillata]